MEKNDRGGSTALEADWNLVKSGHLEVSYGFLPSWPQKSHDKEEIIFKVLFYSVERKALLYLPVVEYFSIDDVAQITLLQGNALNPYGLEQGIVLTMIDNSKKTWHFLNYTISDWRLPQRLLLVYCFLAAAQYGKFKFGEKYYDDIVKAFNMKPPKVGTTIDVPRNEPDTERDNTLTNYRLMFLQMNSKEFENVFDMVKGAWKNKPPEEIASIITTLALKVADSSDDENSRDRRVISAGKDAEVGARGGEELVKRALNAADNVKDVYSKLPSGMISSLLSAAFYYCVAFGVNLPGPLAGIVAAGYQFYGFFPSMKALAKGIAATSQFAGGVLQAQKTILGQEGLSEIIKMARVKLMLLLPTDDILEDSIVTIGEEQALQSSLNLSRSSGMGVVDFDTRALSLLVETQQERIAKLENALASSNVDRVEFDRLQSEYSAVLQRCEGLLSEIQSKNNVMSSSNDKLSSLSTTITKLEKDLDAERGKKKEAVAKLSKIVEVSKERDSLLKELSQTKEQFSRVEADLNVLQSQQQETQDLLQESKLEAASLIGEFEKSKAEIQSLSFETTKLNMQLDNAKAFKIAFIVLAAAFALLFVLPMLSDIMQLVKSYAGTRPASPELIGVIDNTALISEVKSLDTYSKLLVERYYNATNALTIFDRDCLCRLDVTRVSRPQAITELLEKTVRRLQPLVSANAGHSGDDPLKMDELPYCPTTHSFQQFLSSLPPT